MYRRPVPGQSQNLYGNARFVGYTKELADHLSKELNLEFEIRPVKDGQYGVSDPNVPGGWTGVIGELVRNEADIAISPLTINAQRYILLLYLNHFPKVNQILISYFFFIQRASSRFYSSIYACWNFHHDETNQCEI